MRGNNDTVTIINNEFIAFHALCRATRYRVHAPNCACRKVGNLYTRPLLRLYDDGKEEGVGTAAASSAGATATRKDDGNNVRRENDGTFTSNNNNDDDDDDVDDNNCSKLLSRLDLTSKTTSTIATAATAPVRGQITTTTIELLNNLIVLPDTQSSHPKYIYVCTDTHGRAFQSNWKRCEDKLANEIFNDNNNDASLPSSPPPPSFKVSCAICLLRHRSNGFAVILSPTMSTLLPTIQAANNNARRLLDKDSTSTNSSSSSSSGLHADHAHFLCAVELSLLRQLVAVSKSSFTDDDDEEGVGNNIVRQIESSSSSSNDNAANNCIQRQRRQRQRQPIQIKLGHHITSLLHLLAELPRSNNNDDDSNNNFKCVMLMGYNDSIVVSRQQQQQHPSATTNKTSSIKLDLPGGKRHLGETTLCCVQREVMEECSLLIKYDWLYTRVSMQYGGSIDVDDRLEKKNDMGTVVVGGRRMTVSRRIHGHDGTPTVDRKNGKDDDAFVHVLTSKCKDCHDVFFVMTPPQHTSLP